MYTSHVHTRHTRLQVVALITIEVHARDVIDKLTKSNCSSVNDFEWVSQLRFYWDRDLNECVVKQVRGCGVLSCFWGWAAGWRAWKGGAGVWV